MARVVLVTTAELPESRLESHVGTDDELIVVAPAVEQSRLQWLANDEGGARADAERVGEAVARAAPTVADAVDVKPDTPLQLVLDAIAEHRPDRIVVALREGEDSTWLEEGELDALPTEIEGIPLARIRIET